MKSFIEEIRLGDTAMFINSDGTFYEEPCEVITEPMHGYVQVLFENGVKRHTHVGYLHKVVKENE